MTIETTGEYRILGDFDDDGAYEAVPDVVHPDGSVEDWQTNALLGLLCHLNGDKLELDLKRLREIVGRPLAIHFDMTGERAVIELLPEEAKPATCAGSSRRQ